jgi:hypothetical protein
VVALALDPENRELYDEALAQLNEFIERGVFDEDPAAGRALTAHARRLLTERATRFPSSPAPVSLAQIEFLAAMVELHSGHPDGARPALPGQPRGRSAQRGAARVRHVRDAPRQRGASR